MEREFGYGVTFPETILDLLLTLINRLPMQFGLRYTLLLLLHSLDIAVMIFLFVR